MFGRRASPNVVPLEAGRPAAAPTSMAVALLPEGAEGVNGAEDGAGEARGHFTREAGIEVVIGAVMPRLLARPEAENALDAPRHELAAMIADMVDAELAEGGPVLEPDARRDAVTVLLNESLPHSRSAHRAANKTSVPAASPPEDSEIATSRDSVEEAKRRIQPLLMERIDAAKASETPRQELARQIGDIAAEILAEEKLRLNLLE